MRLIEGGTHREPCAQSVADRQRHEHRGEPGDSGGEGTKIAVGHRPVDDHADQHGDRNLTGLMEAQQKCCAGQQRGVASHTVAENGCTGPCVPGPHVSVLRRRVSRRTGGRDDVR